MGRAAPTSPRLASLRFESRVEPRVGPPLASSARATPMQIITAPREKLLASLPLPEYIIA